VVKAAKENRGKKFMRGYVVPETGDLASIPALTTPILSNTDRLRAHLIKDGLAAALLSAWQHGEASGARARMHTALNEFYNPKQPGDDATANPPD
jgi:hypothetical protein